MPPDDDERTPSQIRGAMVTDLKNSSGYLHVLIMIQDKTNVKIKLDIFKEKLKVNKMTVDRARLAF